MLEDRVERQPTIDITLDRDQARRIHDLLNEVNPNPITDDTKTSLEDRCYWVSVVQQATPWYKEDSLKTRGEQIGWQIWPHDPIQAAHGVRVFDPDLVTFDDINGVIPEPNDILRTIRRGSFLGPLISAEIIKPLPVDNPKHSTS